MKAIDWIKNWFMNTPKSTILFWVGCFIALLGAVIQFQLFPFLLVVVGLLVAASQKIVGDREQDQKFEQELRKLEAQTDKGQVRATLSRVKASMGMNRQEPNS